MQLGVWMSSPLWVKKAFGKCLFLKELFFHLPWSKSMEVLAVACFPGLLLCDGYSCRFNSWGISEYVPEVSYPAWSTLAALQIQSQRMNSPLIPSQKGFYVLWWFPSPWGQRSCQEGKTSGPRELSPLFIACCLFIQTPWLGLSQFTDSCDLNPGCGVRLKCNTSVYMHAWHLVRSCLHEGFQPSDRPLHLSPHSTAAAPWSPGEIWPAWWSLTSQDNCVLAAQRSKGVQELHPGDQHGLFSQGRS